MCVRKAQESQKEMKLLLDMYKSAPKEQRDKVQLMAAERKSKAEVCVAIKMYCPLFMHIIQFSRYDNPNICVGSKLVK